MINHTIQPAMHATLSPVRRRNMAGRGSVPSLGLAAALVLFCLLQSGLGADDIDIAPTKDWCKVSGGKESYALNPAGDCVNCQKSPFVTWQVQYGVCPTYLYFPQPFDIVNKGEYKQCVCAAGYWGSPKGMPKGYSANFTTFIDLGCYCCDPGRTRVLVSPVNATSPFQCNVCNPKEALGTAPFCQQKSCPAGSKRNCPDCRCKCVYDPYGSDEGPPEPPCPSPPTQQCTKGLSWDYRAKKCVCEDNVYRPDAGCKCVGTQIPVSAKRQTFPEPTKGGYCSYCELDGELTVTEKGKKVCGCKPGFTTSVLARYFSANPDCESCDGDKVELNSKGECTCKKGLSPFITGDNDDGEAYRGDQLFTAETCRDCTGPQYKVDKATGVCACADGYALGKDNQCVPCKGPGYKIQPAAPGSYRVAEGLPECRCEVGYYSKDAGKDTFVCTKCPAGTTTKESVQLWDSTNITQSCFCKDPLRDLFNNCACKFGYQEDKKGRCVKKRSCNNALSASFWSATQLPSSWTGGAFPDTVLKSKPASVVTLKVPFNATSLKAWTAAGVPASIITAKFAAQLKGCVCRPPTPILQLAPYDQDAVESEFFVVVEKADASMVASPPLRDGYFLGDRFDNAGITLKTPVISVTGGSTGSKHVGQVKAAYIHEVCLQYDIKFWADAPQSKGPMLSVYVYTSKEWGSF